MDPITLSALISAGSQIMTTAFNAAYNKPKAQIRRLKAAGIHPNAFYSMGNVGNVTASSFAADMGGIASAKNESDKVKLEREKWEQLKAQFGDDTTIKNIPEEFQDLVKDKSIFQISNMATAFGSMASAARTIKETPSSVRKITAEGALAEAGAAKVQSETDLIKEQTTSEKLNQIQIQSNISKTEAETAREYLNIQGQATQNEILSIERDLKGALVSLSIEAKKLENARTEQQIKESKARVLNLYKDTVLKQISIDMGADEKAIKANKRIQSALEIQIAAQKTRLLTIEADIEHSNTWKQRQEMELIEAPWTWENASEKSAAIATKTIRETLNLMGTPLQGILSIQ